jgi:hypothetical protein
MRATILFCLTAMLATRALAHDPYEITSVAYLYSNRTELFIEMEFPTGLNLAGQKPTREVVAASQFETALPRLRELAGRFYEFTAGNHVVLPLATNVELGVEDHIRFRLEFAPTAHRPLRFVARGLGAEAGETPYGTSLTVLDMVNQKVLGQTTLFAATPTAEFPPRVAEFDEIVPPPVAANPPDPAALARPSASQPAAPVAASEALPPPRIPNWLLGCATVAAVFFISLALFRRRE